MVINVIVTLYAKYTVIDAKMQNILKNKHSNSYFRMLKAKKKRKAQFYDAIFSEISVFLN